MRVHTKGTLVQRQKSQTKLISKSYPYPGEYGIY